jgi:hypothetical protein
MFANLFSLVYIAGLSHAKRRPISRQPPYVFHSEYALYIDAKHIQPEYKLYDPRDGSTVVLL